MAGSELSALKSATATNAKTLFTILSGSPKQNACLGNEKDGHNWF